MYLYNTQGLARKFMHTLLTFQQLYTCDTVKSGLWTLDHGLDWTMDWMDGWTALVTTSTISSFLSEV